MRMIARVFCVALVSLGVARAEDVCRADIDKLCAGVHPGDGRILTCLHAKEAELSPACKQQVSAVGKRVREIGKACGDDVYLLCPDVRMGGGRILKCLASNGSKLSPACEKVVQQTEEKTTEFKKACSEDAAKLCQGVPRGQGRVLACLESKKAELSPACQAMMASFGGQQAAAPAAAPAGAPAAAPGAAPAAAPAAPAAAPAAPAAPPGTPPAPAEPKK